MNGPWISVSSDPSTLILLGEHDNLCVMVALKIVCQGGRGVWEHSSISWVSVRTRHFRKKPSFLSGFRAEKKYCENYILRRDLILELCDMPLFHVLQIQVWRCARYCYKST